MSSYTEFIFKQSDDFYIDKKLEQLDRNGYKIISVQLVPTSYFFPPNSISARFLYHVVVVKEEVLESNSYSDIYAGDFVKVEAGSFKRGEGENLHKVTLTNDFYIGKYPVTQAQWEKIMGNNPSNFKGNPNHPVESVSWYDTQIFIQKLNKITGKNYRLPTEAEWEFAARGGIQSKGFKYSGSDDFDTVAWYANNSNRKTQPVGQKKANELGIHDMSGNVWEWCQDWYGNYSPTDQINPVGPSIGEYRVFRGGSWYDFAVNCLVANRYDGDPVNRCSNRGFRLLSPVE